MVLSEYRYVVSFRVRLVVSGCQVSVLFLTFDRGLIYLP